MMEDKSKGLVIGSYTVESIKRDDDVEIFIRLQSPQTVAKRACVLAAMVEAAFGKDKELCIMWLEDEGLWELVTEKEKSFLLDKNPPEQDVKDATWRIEAILVLLWAMNRMKDLGGYSDECDPKSILAALPQIGSATRRFITDAKIRDYSEIESALETLFEYHWCVVNERINSYEIPADYPALSESIIRL